MRSRWYSAAHMKLLLDTFYSLLNYRKSGRLGSAEERQRQKTVFLLCGLYCLVAMVFLGVFGSAALQQGSIRHGQVLLGFAALTALLYALIWISGRYYLANHLVTLLMGLLCLYLLYTGGESNTGPLWYFVFPPLALFLQGTVVGLASIMLLFVLSCFVALLDMQGLGPTSYSLPFLQRMAAVYVAVAALGCLFAYTRNETEQRLRESNRQLAALSGYDALSGLVSRRRAEIVLEVEARKYERYRSRFCLVLFRIDGLGQLQARHGQDFADFVIQEVARLLKQEVRFVDLLSRWDDDMFGVLLPATSLAGAVQQAERLRLRATTQYFSLDGKRARITLSAGVGEYRGAHIGRFIHDVRQQLAFSVATGGNCVMFADVKPAAMTPPV